MIKLFSIVWLVLFSVNATWAQTVAPQSPPASRIDFNSDVVDQAVLAEMKRQKIVGAAVGVIRDGQVIYTQGYGLADVEHNTPVTTETIFNWASNSKPVVAIAALQLVEAGKLDLDASIRTYLPSLPEALGVVTPRHLLCHQSGIPHYSNGKIVSTGRTIEPKRLVDPELAIERFVNSPLIYQPGEKSTYSSYAYVLLSAVVQAAGEQPIQTQLDQRILNPLKMTSFQLDLPYQGQTNWTLAYRFDNDQPVKISDTAHFWKHGAGAYKSNIKDFANWTVALMKSELIEPATTKKMWEPQLLRSGDAASYGLGVAVNDAGARLKISHGGSQDETKTRMVFYPNQNHGMVVMCNTTACQPEQITTKIYQALKAASAASAGSTGRPKADSKKGR